MDQGSTTGAFERTGLGAAVHELHARLGSVNIAVTSVTELNLDGALRDEMLATASEEVVRASAELAGVGAFAACLVDGHRRAVVDLAAMVTEVTEVARLSGVDAKVAGASPAPVWAASDSLRRSLAALTRIVAGYQGGVAIEVSATADKAVVSMARVGPDREELPTLVRGLVAAFGGDVDALDNGALTFSFPVSS